MIEDISEQSFHTLTSDYNNTKLSTDLSLFLIEDAKWKQSELDDYKSEVWKLKEKLERKK